MLTEADRKRYRALQDKKARGMAKRFLVQGRKVVAELLGSRFETEIILATAEAAAFIAPLAAKARVRVEVQPPQELDKIGTFEKGNELIAIAVAPDPLAFRAPAGDELMLALDGVREFILRESLQYDFIFVNGLICCRSDFCWCKTSPTRV